MDLEEYLHQNRLSIKEFANRIGYHRTSIGEVINGTRRPGNKMIRFIEVATEGLVTREDLLKEKKINNSFF
jgi:DNA-binding transcriptional regulator YdaS (Cro superfamily)